MLAKIIIRNSSEVEWRQSNPLLEKGEMGYENNTSKFKIGNGVDHWNDLPYQLGHWKIESNGDISFPHKSEEDGNVRIRNNLQIDGSLFVKGTTTTLNSKEVTFNDRIITLNWSEDPVKYYDDGLISGIEVNIGWPDTQLAPLYQGEGTSSIQYYPEDNQSVITLDNPLSDWPSSSTYRENYVIYFSSDVIFENPDLAFVIKSYNETTKQLTVLGDASGVSSNRHFEIHNVIRQLYWNNNLSGWNVDDNFYANNGVVFGNNTRDEIGTIRWTGTDFQGRFDGYWKSLSSSTYVGDTVPNNPSNSDLWWDSSDGTLRIYYTDENSSQWVVIGSGGTSTTTSGGGDYGDTDVEFLLNRSNVSDGYILSWDTSLNGGLGDYSWIQPSAGTEGPAGQDGSDGLSAYEIAVQNDFQGDEAAWLDSLVGPAGQDGINGTNGTNGSDGSDGLSAYEIAQNNGYGGTEAAWLASLVGPAGQDGTDGATTLNDLTDVNTAGLTNGSILKYNGTSWIIGTDDTGGSSFSGSYNDLTDKPTIPSIGNFTFVDETIDTVSSAAITVTPNITFNGEVTISSLASVGTGNLEFNSAASVNITATDDINLSATNITGLGAEDYMDIAPNTTTFNPGAGVTSNGSFVQTDEASPQDIEVSCTVTTGFTSCKIEVSMAGWDHNDGLNEYYLELCRIVNGGTPTVLKDLMFPNPNDHFVPCNFMHVDVHGASAGDTVAYKLRAKSVASTSFRLVTGISGDTIYLKEIR